MSHNAAHAPDTAPRLDGLLVEFDSPGALLTAAEQMRDAGYTKWDTHSPFPVHGIDQAMGVRPTRLPWIVLICGLLGCGLGVLLQWWTNSTDPTRFSSVPVHFQGYDFQLSGKPLFSLPANIPVIFELTVLLAAIAAVVGMLAMNNLPLHRQAIHTVDRFKRVTADRFFITVSAADPRFEATRTAQFLTTLGGTAIERVEDPPTSNGLPRALVIGGLILIALALLPPLFVAKARLATSSEPRIHIIRDMANQERFKAQQANPIFSDGRELRPQVPGTVARGDLRDDPHFYQGLVSGEWATTYPPQIEQTAGFIRRGQQRFNIYCASCHGLGGAGDGIVAKRAADLGTPGWNPPTSLVGEAVRERPHGHVFNTITNGIRTMPPYGDQIPEQDRWAIVAYVRALQRSQNAALEDVPPEVRSELR